MSTDTNTSPPKTQLDRTLSQEIIDELDKQALHIPIDQMIQELQTIVERMTFGDENGKEKLTLSDIEMLLGDDTSPEMIRFVMWVQQRNVTRLLVGKNGRHFLAFCLKHYRTVQEVRCIVPLKLREPFRETLLTHLRMLYPEPARIIFQTSPSIAAGCIIDDGSVRTDMSLQAKMPSLVGEYVAARRPLRRMPHGK